MKFGTKLLLFAVTLLLTLSGFFAPALAAPMILQRSFHFCDVKSVNDVNFGIGNGVTFGVDLTPDGDLDGDGFADSDGVSPPSRAVASQDGVVRSLNFFPLAESPNHFVRTVVFDCNNPTSPDLRDSWNLTISNGVDTCAAGSCTLNGTVITNPVTPSIQGVQNLPFVASFSFQVTGDPTTPIFSWSFPPGSTHDQVTIWIQDLQDFIGQGGVGGRGSARVIFQEALGATETSFAMPSGVLDPDHLYSVSIQLDSRRQGPLGNPLFNRLQSRSRAFFSFKTEVLPTGEAPVFLPSVNPTGGPTGGPQYHFNVASIQPGQTIFIDPPFSIGYDYQIGNGNPNFNSVLLPPAGDNVFDLFLWNGSSYVFRATVKAGEEHAFPSGGVDRFRVLGIEPSAGLDPNDATAFVTGLTFVSAGQFTGTMTPIVPAANNLVTFAPINSTFQTTANTSGCPAGFVGKFSFNARLTDKKSSPALSRLLVKVTTLTNGNLLQNADGGPAGVGATLTVANGGGFADGALNPGEFVDVPFIICLQQNKAFSFLVDVFGIGIE